MTIQQILNNLFSFGGSGEAIALTVILLLTFALGAVLCYFVIFNPKYKKLKKEHGELTSKFEALDAKYKALDEKYNIQLSKTKRLEEEAAKNEQLHEDQKFKLSQVQQLYTILEGERDAKIKRAEAAERELHEIKNLFNLAQLDSIETEQKLAAAVKERELATAKTEELKSLMEEIERERFNVSDNLEHSALKIAEAKAEADAARRELEEIKTAQKKTQLFLAEQDKMALEMAKTNSEQKQYIVRLEQEISELNTKLEQKSVISIFHQPPGEPQTVESIIYSDKKELLIPMDEAEEESASIEGIISIETTKAEEPVFEMVNSIIKKEEPVFDQVIENKKLAAEKALSDEIYNILPRPQEGQKDDLKQIYSIDFGIEEKLNKVGICTFEQVSGLTDSNFNQRLLSMLAIKDGIVERDQWVAQARQIITRQKINNLTKDINLNKLFKK
jgi:predicted flap endonuclease-1-like 5' DNA nuclease